MTSIRAEYDHRAARNAETLAGLLYALIVILAGFAIGASYEWAHRGEPLSAVVEAH